jgi:streptogramin lyase
MRGGPRPALLVVSAALLGLALGAGARAGRESGERVSGKDASSSLPPDAARVPRGSSAWLRCLPDGEAKRRFVLDCTGCHVFDGAFVRKDGRPRTRAEWAEDIERMLGYAGAGTSFPVISAACDRDTLAEWLARHLPDRDPAIDTSAVVFPGVTEYLLPEPRDLPHDVALDARGRVVVTGMMTHRMYVLDPATARFDSLDIPVPRANPRAVEIDSSGNWWVVLGAPKSLARYAPAAGEWRTWEVGMYPHSLALSGDGAVWFNGHFTRDPELIGRVLPGDGTVERFPLPKHPTMAAVPGGPIPYELRVAPDGRVWTSELLGNRLIAYDPATGRSEAIDMPEPESGPRRFDFDAEGRLWIPGYAVNALLRLDPRTREFTTLPLPIEDAVPYVVRVDRESGRVWIGTAAADVVLAFDPAGGRFEEYPLPSRGALVRHLAIDPRTHHVWAAYGASPGIPARIARIVPRAPVRPAEGGVGP